MRRAAVWIATLFGVGYAPVAPATVASLLVALLLLPCHEGLTPFTVGLALLVLLPVGVWAAGEAERMLGHDARPIVIDEVIGMMVAVWWVPLGSRPWLLLLLAFVLFRVFDIVKPFPIRASQRLPGGWGVVVDDVLAGIATNLVLRLAVGWVSP